MNQTMKKHLVERLDDIKCGKGSEAAADRKHPSELTSAKASS